MLAPIFQNESRLSGEAMGTWNEVTAYTNACVNLTSQIEQLARRPPTGEILQ